MENKPAGAAFFKSTLTGLFTGIVATIIALFYNAGFRNATNYVPADYINVSSLIFMVNLIFLCLGVIHFFFRKVFHSGETIYIVLFGLLTVFCLWRTGYAHRSGDPVINGQFKILLDGVILIIGIGAVIAIPLLFHSKKFEEEVLGTPQI